VDSVKQQDGSILATVKSTRPDLNWSSLLQQAIPFSVRSGKRYNATCRACGTLFGLDDLSVQTTLLTTNYGIRPCSIQFCANMQCIQTGLKRYSNWQVAKFVE